MKLKFGLFIGVIVVTLAGNDLLAQQTESKFGQIV